MRRAGRQRRRWTRRAPEWNHDDVPGLARVARAVLDHAGPTEGLVAVDLGAGSGQLTLELARRAAEVKAVDISPRMLDLLQARASAEGLANITSIALPLQAFDLPAASVDLIVTNYALHHLRPPEKEHLVAQAGRWLRPGGRIVIGDMMFGRGADARDRQIIVSKALVMARRGPAGWWRLAKNGWRFVVRRDECPAPIGVWEAMLTASGFLEISSQPVVAEAAVVSARAPARVPSTTTTVGPE